MFKFKKKEPTLTELEMLSDFYIMDLYDLMNDDYTDIVKPENPIHGLHPEDVSEKDYKSMCEFGRIVKNYQKMKRLETLHT
jgi:hypothetical protein